MKRALARLLLSPEVQGSLVGHGMRALIRATRGFYRYSPQFLLATQATERPHYAYCLLHAAELARSLGRDRISAIEFGVAGGNGLVYMSNFAAAVTRATGVAIDCYGFDTGVGMPPPEGPRDLPYWFQEAQYVMDETALRRRVPDAKLVIGQVDRTIGAFIDTHRPAPIGAVFFDMDYESSTEHSLRLFDGYTANHAHFLPRIFMYFDDIIGRHYEMYGPFNGQLAAVNAFNAAHDNMKIHLNQNLLPFYNLRYRHSIYYGHLFAHPDYNTYIGESGQGVLLDALKLKDAEATRREVA